MTQRSPDFARVLAGPPDAHPSDDIDRGPLRGAEIDAVIELAFLMANADGHASIDELESFRALVRHLKPEARLGDLLDRLGDALDKAGSIEARVRAAASALTRRAARDLAYKAAYTIAVFDLETNEGERELDDLLIEVLGLSDRVDALEYDVNAALST